MAFYRYRIKPTSAWATPFRSDTLYGHLLWMAAQWQGSNVVAELIEAFDGASPPFKLSSAFPANCLPMPSLPGIPREHFSTAFSRHGDLLTLMQKYKIFRKQTYLAVDTWCSLVGGLSQEALFLHWLNGTPATSPTEDAGAFSHQVQQPHNSIDRRTGTVLAEGGLYFTPTTWFGRNSLLDLYVETDDIQVFETLFGYLAQVGYGANRSIGKGQFSFERDMEFDAGIFAGEGSYQLSLSVCAAQDSRGFAGYWQPMVKHGRAWSGFGENNPFKKPFFAFVEGSLFRSMPADSYLLRNVHSNPEIVQVTWPLTIPVTLEAEHAS